MMHVREFFGYVSGNLNTFGKQPAQHLNVVGLQDHVRGLQLLVILNRCIKYEKKSYP